MIKRVLLAAPATLALVAATPLAAQDEDAYAEKEMVEADGSESHGSPSPMAGMGALFGELFKVDPLTAEQEARIPAAETIAAKLMPEGAMADLLKGMMSDLMNPILEMGPPPTRSIVTKGLGYNAYDADMTDEQWAQVATLLDPVWEERAQRQKDAFPKMMAEVATVMEPGIRKAFAEIFAVRFEADELAGLQSFLATPLGEKFASEYFSMATDKRMLGASFEALPQIMAKMGDMKNVMERATADLPAARDYTGLTAAQQAQVRELSGLSDAQITEGLTEPDYSADAVEAAAEAAADAVENVD